MKVRVVGCDGLKEWLSAHPGVQIESFDLASEDQISFESEGRTRRAVVGAIHLPETYGLIELMDNNPLVCADEASCPGPAATLALIGFGPLARACAISGPPSVVFSFETTFDESLAALRGVGLKHELIAACDPADMNTAVMATCVIPVAGLSSEENEAIFEEAFSRSFFVRKAAPSQLTPHLVTGHAHAAYALSYCEDENESSVRVQVIADVNGKAGAGQLVHLFNLMAGFEESLGLN